jgi:hypothetical protein
MTLSITNLSKAQFITTLRIMTLSITTLGILPQSMAIMSLITQHEHQLKDILHNDTQYIIKNWYINTGITTFDSKVCFTECSLFMSQFRP